MTFDDSPHSKLDASFDPLLNALRTFQNEVIAWSEMSGADKTTEGKRLHDRYFEIVEAAPRTKSDELDEREADYAFIEGVLRAMQLLETIVDEDGIVDTFGSETVGFFDTDYRGEDGDEAQVMRALSDVTGLSLGELASFDEAFERAELGTLHDRMRVMDAIGDLYDLTNHEAIERLFGLMYPDYVVQDSVDIRAIRTATSLFFCVPFETVSHLGEHEAKAHDDPLAKLWGRVIDLRQRDMAHFPVFGFFEGEDVDDAVLETIADRANVHPEVVTELLTTMISILPAEEVDKYIVHDAWGHQWQSLLFSFEDTYRDTARYQNPPELSHTQGGVSLQGLIEGEEVGTFWDDALEERLIHSVSGLFAEVLADAMEYKFLHVRDDLRDKMPSSSCLKMLPAKLDLTLHDLPIYVRFACRGLKRLADPDEQGKLTDDFLHSHAGASARQVSEVVYQVSESAVQSAQIAEMFEFSTEPDSVTLTPTAQLALQFFELVTAYNDVMLDEQVTAIAGDVFKRHFDLLVFTTASFFERNRMKHFWEIDTFIRDAFVPRYIAFQNALKAQT